MNLIIKEPVLFLSEKKIENEEKDDCLFNENDFFRMKPFNPKLWIVEYFESIINQIDIRAERLIAQENPDEIDITIIEKKRNQMIQNIRKIEQKNLKNLSLNDLEIQKSLDNIIRNKDEFLSLMNLIFRDFCVMVDRETTFKTKKLSNDFGVLLTFQGFLCCEQLVIFKKFITSLNKAVYRKESVNLFNFVRIFKISLLYHLDKIRLET